MGVKECERWNEKEKGDDKVMRKGKGEREMELDQVVVMDERKEI